MPVSPLTTIDGGRPDGCFVSDHCFGTYIHGILDNASVVDYLLGPFLQKAEQRTHFDYAAYKQEQSDRLAAETRRYVDMHKVYDILTSEQTTPQ